MNKRNLTTAWTRAQKKSLRSVKGSLEVLQLLVQPLVQESSLTSSTFGKWKSARRWNALSSPGAVNIKDLWGWISNEGKNIPRDAIHGGEVRGERLYICRAHRKDDLMVGKASRVFEKGAIIGYDFKEIHVERYEILVGNAQAVRWVLLHGRLNLSTLGARQVEGGKEPSGVP
ncbi:hypothetical protein SCLCIDRAFT_952070 [Scleroderma citrinum Foug A]|uniref:Uncharacterized protein n=1 Tax=Scleroderma citrinum Foug A TaxID=1036808 RepID=A0A0C3EKG0_9AGAM|nr:hypothetical protein SCLCIDRAFT_952070 [Scleroderma citrinum Foug A]